MGKLTNDERKIITQCRKIGIEKIDIITLLLMFRRRTLARQKYLINILE